MSTASIGEGLPKQVDRQYQDLQMAVLLALLKQGVSTDGRWVASGPRHRGLGKRNYQSQSRASLPRLEDVIAKYGSWYGPVDDGHYQEWGSATLPAVRLTSVEQIITASAQSARRASAARFIGDRLNITNQLVVPEYPIPPAIDELRHAELVALYGSTRPKWEHQARQEAFVLEADPNVPNAQGIISLTQDRFDGQWPVDIYRRGEGKPTPAALEELSVALGAMYSLVKPVVAPYTN